MVRSSNLKKLALWQGRFRRFSGSGLTVARFCAIEHASESSFYFWQKKLGPQTRQRPARAEDHSTYTKHHGARAEGCGARAAHHGARAEDRGAEDHGVFRPVMVMPGTCGVVIQLPGGTRIEVDAHHLDAIRAVVAETVRIDHGQATERNASSDNQVTQKASLDNQVSPNVPSDNQAPRHTSSGNQGTRTVSFGNEVNRNVSSDNQVMRKRSTIGKRDGSARTSGTVSC